jgi:hypothetical protein
MRELIELAKRVQIPGQEAVHDWFTMPLGKE